MQAQGRIDPSRDYSGAVGLCRQVGERQMATAHQLAREVVAFSPAQHDFTAVANGRASEPSDQLPLDQQRLANMQSN